jgi:hypothetical protein
MKFDNFAVVCRVDGCHGRIKPRDPEKLMRGVCAKCGMDTDEWERVHRFEELCVGWDTGDRRSSRCSKVPAAMGVIATRGQYRRCPRCNMNSRLTADSKELAADHA